MSFDDVYFSSSAAGAGCRPRRGHAWASAVAGIAGPLSVAALLPDPRGQLALLGDPRADVAVGALATLIATGIVYLLLAWAAVIVIVALAGRAPGAVGRAARRTLTRITPALVRQVVVTAAGLSLATGLAACGGQPAAPASMTATPAAVQQAAAHPIRAVAFTIDSPAADPVGASVPPGGGPAATPEASGVPFGFTVDLDWPVTPASSEAATPAAAGPAVSPPMTASPTATPASTAGPAATPAVTASTAPSGQTTTIPTPAAVDKTTEQAAQQPAESTRAATRARPLPGPDGVVVVHRGDSLWSIAAASLPPDAGAAQIDAAWRLWYQANHDVIGPDPGLILPGQQLHAPSSVTASAESGTTAPSTPSHPGGMR